MKKYSENEKKQLLDYYFFKYGYVYESSNIEQIKRDFGKNNKDYMTQIYHALNMYEDKENPYIGFADIIEKVFGLDIDILEIGGGIYPALTEVISKRQIKIGKGTITVYDPNLASENIKLQRATLKKVEFMGGQDISRYDLVIGKEPCGATFDLIDAAHDSGKNYLISPCDCYDLLPEFIDYNDNPIKQWYSFVKDICKIKDTNVETHYLPESMNYDAPVYTIKHY